MLCDFARLLAIILIISIVHKGCSPKKNYSQAQAKTPIVWEQTKSPEPSPEGFLIVDADYVPDTLFLEVGEKKEVTLGQTVTLPPGSYRLVSKHECFLDYVREFQITEKKTTHINLPKKKQTTKSLILVHKKDDFPTEAQIDVKDVDGSEIVGTISKRNKDGLEVDLPVCTRQVEVHDKEGAVGIVSLFDLVVKEGETELFRFSKYGNRKRYVGGKRYFRTIKEKEDITKIEFKLTDYCTESPTGKGGPMCKIPKGKFTYGCPIGDIRRYHLQDDVLPERTITLDTYYIDMHHVTQREYQNCVAANVCRPPKAAEKRNRDFRAGFEFHPITEITWTDANRYCQWVGKRLPTETEWEKAVRGPGKRRFPWGDLSGKSLPDCRYAVMNDGLKDADLKEIDKSEASGRILAKLTRPRNGCGFDAPWPVCSKPLGNSYFGLCDGLGNVLSMVEIDQKYSRKAWRKMTAESQSVYLSKGSSFVSKIVYRCHFAGHILARDGIARYSGGFRCAYSE